MELKDYHVLNQIGEGSFGKVFKGRRKFTGQVCICTPSVLTITCTADGEKTETYAVLLARCTRMHQSASLITHGARLV